MPVSSQIKIRYFYLNDTEKSSIITSFKLIEAVVRCAIELDFLDVLRTNLEILCRLQLPIGEYLC